jgi:hypothetical protein
MSSQVVLNKTNSLFFLQKLLNKRFNCVFEAVPCNLERHFLLRSNVVSVPVFYFKFTTDWFHTFNLKFPEFINEFPEYAGLGQSVNKEFLEYAFRRGADYFVVGLPDNTFHMVSVALWLRYSKEHGLVRVQDKLNDSRSKGCEVTYCLPAKMFERLEE